MRPQLAGLTKKHGDKVVVLKVNVDRQRTLASLAGVRSIPDRRLFFAGRQLERSVGGTRLASLERIVIKHAGRLDSPGPVLAQTPPMPKKGLRRLEHQLQEVRTGNEMQGTNRPVSKPKPQAEGKSGTIDPMGKDWLPPGVTRVE